MNSRLFLTLAFAAASLSRADTKIKRADLPAPVQQALPGISQGATILGFGKETENGKTLYEIEMKSGKLTRDVTVDASGTVLIVEQEVTLGSLPQLVQNGLLKAAGAGKISKLESITEGSKVTYEAALKGGKTKEVVVDKDGKIVSNK